MESITIRMPEQTAKRLRALAKHEKRSISNFIRMGVERFIKEKGGGSTLSSDKGGVGK